MGADHEEVVILVHGTGASELGATGNERWWQPESAFAQELLAELSARCSEQSERRFRLEAFVWSGANSERERRIAGQALARHLKDLEERHRPFHLVGHSHGGSVIWHAMLRMLREGRPAWLRSWTTVGTPFLTFGDRGALYLLLFLFLSIFTVVLTGLLLGPVVPIYWNEVGRVLRDAAPLALVGAIAGVLVAAAVAAYSLVVLALQLWKRVRSRSPALSAEDAAFLGERWLPLAHPEDEPINALRASVIQPAERFMPRLKPALGAREAGILKGANEGGPAGSRPARPPITPGNVAAALVMRIAAPFYNRIVAPLLDQFLWETAKQVAQGKDVPGEYLIRCDRSPPELAGFWKDASPDLLERLSTQADSAAAGTARSIRSRLVAIGEGTSSVSALGGALSWREVIHTAYFEPGSSVAAVAAGTIAGAGAGAGIESAPARTPSAEPAGRRRPVYRPRSLHLALTGAAAALCTAGSFSAIAVERAWLWPYTNAFQIDQIYTSLFEARSTSLRLMDGLDDILVRWVLLDRTEEAIATALRLEDMIRYMGANARLERLQDIAFAIGAKGSAADLDLLLGSKVCAQARPECLEGLSKEEVTAYLLVHAAAGARAARNGAHLVPERKLEELLSKVSRESWSPGYLTRLMLHAGAFELAERFAERNSSFCDGVGEWAGESPSIVPTDRIPARLRDCLDAPISAYVADQSYGYENYFSRPAAVLRRLVAGLPSSDSRSCKSEVLGAVHAMKGCEEDRANFFPVFPGESPAQISYHPGRTAPELLTEISSYAYQQGGDLPACVPKLDERLGQLQLCLRSRGQQAPLWPVGGTGPTSSEGRLSWWKTDVWSAGAEQQAPICGDDGSGRGGGYGRKMQDVSSRLAELTPQDSETLKRLIALRTDHELRQPHFIDPARAGTVDMLDARCGWAALALAWGWLGNEEQAAKLLEAVLPKQSPASGTRILDFYLGIADGLSRRAPAQAKRFLDRSFDLVDDNDPTLFAKTSDGSLDETFAYRKSDIARLYADIGEYRLAAATNDRVDQFGAGAVSTYLNILDSEIRRARRYDDAVLQAVLKRPRPPGFRLQ